MGVVYTFAQRVRSVCKTLRIPYYYISFSCQNNPLKTWWLRSVRLPNCCSKRFLVRNTVVIYAILPTNSFIRRGARFKFSKDWGYSSRVKMTLRLQDQARKKLEFLEGWAQNPCKVMSKLPQGPQGFKIKLKNRWKVVKN